MYVCVFLPVCACVHVCVRVFLHVSACVCACAETRRRGGAVHQQSVATQLIEERGTLLVICRPGWPPSPSPTDNTHLFPEPTPSSLCLAGHFISLCLILKDMVLTFIKVLPPLQEIFRAPGRARNSPPTKTIFLEIVINVR